MTKNELRSNPFEYAGASNLAASEVEAVFVQDHNFSRFIESTRNVFLFGERGSGKSMTLLYNSFKVQYLKRGASALSHIGVFINCNTPLFHRREYAQLRGDEFKAAVLSEHVLVLWIAQAIIETLTLCDELREDGGVNKLRESIEYILDYKLPEGRNFWESLRLVFVRESSRAQTAMNRGDWNFEDKVYHTFSSLIFPLINELKSLDLLSAAHFMLMIDDAQYLNGHQARALNSWISYRDHSDFSFKVAVAKNEHSTFVTAAGGAILEGHDYIQIDLEEPLQNKDSRFGKLARDIVAKRLQRIGIEADPDTFFPIGTDFENGIRSASEEVKRDYLRNNPDASPKQVSDHVYKYGRVRYFRSRDPKANLPPYSGFDTIVHLSSGVVRNLLEPCFWMFEAAYSDLGGKDAAKLKCVPSTTQAKVLKDRSQALWSILEDGLDRKIPDCTDEQAIQIRNLFDQLAVLFRERLLRHPSEPRVLAFTISERRDREETLRDIMKLLDIARKASLLYYRWGTAKDRGKRELYFVPNRLLWPIRGLDPFGQHGRASLKLTDIWNATQNKPFPYAVAQDEKDEDDDDAPQLDLFL